MQTFEIGKVENGTLDTLSGSKLPTIAIKTFPLHWELRMMGLLNCRSPIY